MSSRPLARRGRKVPAMHPNVQTYVVVTGDAKNYFYSPDLSSDYYTSNSFLIGEADEGLQWLQKIGPQNVSQLTKVAFSIPSFYRVRLGEMMEQPSGPPWVQILTELFNGAPNVEEFYIYWHALLSIGEMGGGSDLGFVRAFGKMALIKSLRTVEIGGFFAKEWPGYLERRFGFKVWDKEGAFVAVKPGYLNDLNSLSKYQAELPDLHP